MATKSTAVATFTKLETVTEMIGNSDINNVSDLTAVMQAAKTVANEELQLLTGSYQELKDGETYIFAVVGIQEKAMKSMKPNATEEDMVDAVMLVTEAGEETINADVVMLSTVKKMILRGITPPFLIKVFVDGKKGAKGSEYKNLQIWGYNKK